MPLEQIGSTLQLYGNASPSPIERRQRSGETFDGERNQWVSGTPLLTGEDGEDQSHPTPDASTSRLVHNEDMTLLKLGGVGGVQRSGSWNYGGSAGRSAFRSSLSDSPEDCGGDDDVIGHQRDQYNAQQPRSPRSIPWRRPTSASTDAHPSTGSFSDVPSSSSRTSTSSSSAAAFSLRSLSNRNSASSTASSASSSVRRLASDEGRAASASGTEADSEATIGREAESGQDISQATESTSSLATQTANTEPSASHVGPKLQRIQSIGRGYDIRKARASQGTLDEAKDASSPPAQEAAGDTEDTNVHSAQEDQLVQDRADETIVAPPARSPRQPATPTESSTTRLPSSPSSYSTTAEMKNRIDALTLTAAAQSPPSPEDAPKFVLPEPRRHTGSFALRSRSALSQTLGGSALNFGSGQGRAAARRELAHNLAMQSAKADHANTAALNADLPEPLLYGGASDTPRASIVHIEPISGTNIPAWQSSGDALSRLSQGSHPPAISPRSRPSELSIPSLLTKKAWPGSSDDNQMSSFVSRGDSYLSPIARASPDANTFAQMQSSQAAGVVKDTSSPCLHDGLRLPFTPTGSEAAYSSPPFEAESIASPHDLVPASGSALGISPSRSSLTESFSGSSGGVSRPHMARSSTSLAGLNVLRTPTTEEWSRYLIKQGLDPSLIAAAPGLTTKTDGARSRTNTSWSTLAAKRRISDRDLVPSHGTSHSVDTFDPEAIAEAIQRQGLSSSEVMEAARESMRHSRPSVTSSARADDLRSVHEEDSDEEGDLGTTQRISAEPSSGSDEEFSDGMDERMRALHEAISRPPSRRGTPAPSESGHEKLSGSIEALHPQAEARRGLRWPSRDTAAALMGYPLPPPGEQRSINDFAIVDDIGRGAYGLVKKVRVKDEVTGQPIGPEFCIKYIIKSRILADCWRRHKVLGPIPVEIHVLDQLRRLPYQVPVDPPPWSAEKLFGSECVAKPINVDRDADEPIITVGHPALCMMVDFFEDHEFYYMVMPCFGTGQDLFDYVESQPHGLTTKQVRCILGQLADGLCFLHQNNIVHRDVKDENVVLDGKGHIQLIDFGSAAHINTRNGGRLFDTFSGTLDYAAAEILRGEKYSGKEQDVWALGVVSYVLLCGDCPFWNGEEAMEGLREGTRAHTVLMDRARSLTKQEVTELDTVSPATATMDNVKFGVDRFSGQPTVHSPPPADPADAAVERRQQDLDGQPDGGGRLGDAVDLILRCLELEPSSRPTMDQICRHRFLSGKQGWFGPLGGQRQL